MKDRRRGHANAKGGSGSLTARQTAWTSQGRKKAWKANRKTGTSQRKDRRLDKTIGRQEACISQKEGRRRGQANRKTEGVDKPIGRQEA
jgi:hypothetical protein